MTETAPQPKKKRRTSASRLLLAVFVSILLFIGLALAEDYGRKYLDRRRALEAATAADAAGEKVVEEYVAALAETYLKGSPVHLEQADVATANQVTQVRLYMSYNHFEKKQKLLAELKSQEVDKVEIAGGEATVTATETWMYAYYDEATAQEMSRETETLKVNYRLIKSAGKWLVDSLTASEVDK